MSTRGIAVLSGSSAVVAKILEDGTISFGQDKEVVMSVSGNMYVTGGIEADTIVANNFIGPMNNFILNTPDKTILFTKPAISGGENLTFTGSTQLIYDYNANILSGTVAEFTVITGSITGNLAQFSTITGSDVLVSQLTASLISSSNIFSNRAVIDIVTGSFLTSSNIVATTITGHIIYAEHFTGSHAHLDYIDFNGFPGEAPWRTGRLYYNTASNLLSVYTEYPNTHIHIGQQLVAKVQNDLGTTLAKGKVVYITGSTSSDVPRVVTASWENDTYSARTLGLVMADILSGERGYVILEGLLEGLNTSDYLPGQLVYLSSSGNITNIVPPSPFHEVRLGEVVRKNNNNGSIFVRIQNGYELSELHDVEIPNPQNGDILTYSTSSFNQWINSKTLNGSYTVTNDLTASNIKATTISASQYVGTLTGTLFGTASYANNADLLDGLNSTEFSRLTQNNTFTGINIFNNDLTGTNAVFTNNLVVLGTASISQLNTVNQTSLNIGDKYITLLTGASDHLSLDGSGILWGSGSAPGVTHDDLGADAHVRYDASKDKLRIFPGLFVSGGLDVSSDLVVTGTTTLSSVSGTTARFTSITSSFTGSASGLYNLTASGISNFTNDVRTQFSSGTGININSGIISTNNIPNSSLQNSSINLNGNSISLGNTASLGIIREIQAGSNIVVTSGTSVTASISLSSSLTGLISINANSITGNLLGTASYATNANNASTVTNGAYLNTNNTFTGINTFNNYITSSITGTDAKFTTITGSISGSLAEFGRVNTSIISASTYLGLSNVGGMDKTIQFNSGSTFSGSSNLIYDYTTNTLSGTTAQFTDGTYTNLTSSNFYNSLLAGFGTSSLSNYRIIAKNTSIGGINAIRVEQSNNAIGLDIGIDTSNAGVIRSGRDLILSGGTNYGVSVKSSREMDFYAGTTGVALGRMTFLNGNVTVAAIPYNTYDFVISGTVGSTTQGRLRFANLGTAAAPLITQLNDTNSGIYFPDADTVSISTNGAERLRITGSGDIILGNVSGTTAQFTTLTGSTIVSTTILPNFVAINTSSNNTHRLLINQSSQANNGIRVAGIGSTIDLYGGGSDVGTIEFAGTYSIGHQASAATNGFITAGRNLVFRTWDNSLISGFLFAVSSSGAGFNNVVAQITRTGDIYAVGNITGSLISGSTGQFTAVTSSFTGSGAGLFNLTASGISNFTNDVRAQFSAGTNITINNGVISASGGINTAGGTDTTIQFNSGSTFSGSNLLTYNYTTNILSGTTAQFTNIVTNTLTGSSINITGTLSASSAQSIIKSDQGISLRTRDNGTGSFAERMFISTNDTVNVYSSLNTTSLTASVITANVITSSVTLTGSTAQFTVISGTNISATTLIASNGAAGTPSITFVGDSDTGFYWNGSSGDIGIANNGNRTFILGAAGISSNVGGGIFLLPGAGNTAAGPAYAFNTDLDTGMYRPSANNIAFATSGSERIRIDDTGNVGIRTTSPNFTLAVTGTLGVSGNTTLASVSGTTAQFTQITASVISASQYIGITGGSSKGSFGITIDGSGEAISTGVKNTIVVPYNGTITGWYLIADQTGSIVIDLWKSTFANYPPVSGGTIAGTEKPTLTNAVSSSDTNLTTWNTSLSIGDAISFNVDSASTITRATLVITTEKV